MPPRSNDIDVHQAIKSARGVLTDSPRRGCGGSEKVAQKSVFNIRQATYFYDYDIIKARGREVEVMITVAYIGRVGILDRIR